LEVNVGGDEVFLGPYASLYHPIYPQIEDRCHHENENKKPFSWGVITHHRPATMTMVLTRFYVLEHVSSKRVLSYLNGKVRKKYHDII
jgi:hypothetical protein